MLWRDPSVQPLGIKIMKAEKKLEKSTIEKIAGIYCSNKHGVTGVLCYDCSKLLADTIHLVNKCPYSPKPACGACKTNCFSVEHKRKMNQVMKYSGARMLFRHPILTINHLWKLGLPKNLLLRSAKRRWAASRASR